MNCGCCPHMKRILNALKPCQTCEAGKLHGQVSTDAWSLDRAMDHRVLVSHEPTRCVTNLSPDQEDSLRKAMAELWQLDPIELLLLQWVIKGNSYASFSKPLLRLRRRLMAKGAELEGRKKGFRQLAKTWADSLKRKLPFVVPVLRARIDGL